jgi:hypothetical protein
MLIPGLCSSKLVQHEASDRNEMIFGWLRPRPRRRHHGGHADHIPNHDPNAGLTTDGPSIAPPRSYDLTPASNALGGGSKQGQCEASVAFCDCLWRRQERIEEQRGRKQPEVDCSAEHGHCSQSDRNGRGGCPQLPPGAIRAHTGPPNMHKEPKLVPAAALDLGSRPARPHLNRRSFRFASALLAALSLTSRYSDRSPTSSRISFSVIR